MFFEIDIPGHGPIYVRANDQQEARTAAARWMRGMFPTRMADLSNTLVRAVAAGSIPRQATRINAGELNETTHPATEAGTPNQGYIRDTGRTPDPISRSGQSVMDDMTMLSGNAPAEIPPGNMGGTPNTGSGGTGGGIGSGNVSLPTSPVDVQDFPLASFLNAISREGYNPYGVLGSTFRRQFDPLASAAVIGNATGRIGDIGESPGSLESFFGSNFGGGNALAGQVWQDLINGVGNQAQLSPFINPDLASGSEDFNRSTDTLNLARGAAANQMGSFVAGNLLPSNNALRERFSQQLAQGNQPNFLQWVQSTFGL